MRPHQHITDRDRRSQHHAGHKYRAYGLYLPQKEEWCQVHERNKPGNWHSFRLTHQPLNSAPTSFSNAWRMRSMALFTCLSVRVAAGSCSTKLMA